MALASCPLTPAFVDAMIGLANAPWDRDEVDSSWSRTGWPAPPYGSINRIIDDWESSCLDAGDWVVVVDGRPDADHVVGFRAGFALYYEPDGTWEPGEDPALLSFPEDPPSRRWHVDLSADRERFADAWRNGCQTVSERLGRPEVVGQHDEEEQHAVWRLGPRLLVVAQGEDFASHSLYDEAALWAVDFPADKPIPRGKHLYELLVRGSD